METHFENMEQSQTSRARERVVADLKSLARDSEDLLKATAGDATDKAREARERLTRALERARQTCDDLQHQTTQSARDAACRADAALRKHPYEALGIAAFLGLLVGLVAGRR